MRSTIAIHTLTLTIAIVAVVFAVWPVVTDAPWEEDVVIVQPINRTAEIRCQGALDLREALAAAGRTNRSRTYQASELEIELYC